MKKEEVVALRDQQFYRFSCQLFAEMKFHFSCWAEMKIPFQQAISISAGWHARRCMRVRA
jgi:hypothetical protein